jgi:hypothetical protein
MRTEFVNLTAGGPLIDPESTSRGLGAVTRSSWLYRDERVLDNTIGCLQFPL